MQESCIVLGGCMTLLLSFSGDQVWIKESYMGTNVARGGFVMVNFMHHIVWASVPR